MQNMIKIPTTTLRVIRRLWGGWNQRQPISRCSPFHFDLAPNLRQEEWRRNCTIRSDAPPSSESITSSLVGREVKALGKTLNETVIPRKVLE